MNIKTNTMTTENYHTREKERQLENKSQTFQNIK